MNEFTKDLNDDNFDSVVLKSEQPVLVDFWAEWCGPCKMLTPTIDSLSEEYDGKSIIAKVNVDEAPTIAANYGVRSIPCLLFFKDGKVMEQRVGAVSKDEIASVLNNLIEG